MYGLGSVCTFPNRQSLQTVPASACKYCFGEELTELADGSDYDVNACQYYRLPAGSYWYASIVIGEQEATLVMLPVILSPTSARTGGEICLSNIGENTPTQSTQLRMGSEVMESVLITKLNESRNLLKPPTTEPYFISASNQRLPTNPIEQEMIGATAVECIPISATVSNLNYKACNNKFAIQCEGPMDVA